MIGLNNIREAYEQVYAQLDERMSDDEKEMRRLAAQERRAGKSDRMDSKTAEKYASSEKRSAEREDKKSKGKHIHGMADSVELEGDIVEKKDSSYLETDMKKRMNNNEKAIEAMKKTKAHADMVKAARKHFEEVESVIERTLDTAEKGEKERLVKGMKKSASDFKKRYGERAKSVMYATATKMAKDHMDTSKSDRRYAVEEFEIDESVDVENRKKGPRTPSQMAKREKLKNLMDKIRSDKNSESK
jgi:Na+/phosphate symporter